MGTIHEYRALDYYYEVGYAILCGNVKAKDLVAKTSKSAGFFSKCKKIAKACDTSAEYRAFFVNGELHDIGHAYEIAGDYVGVVATSRVTYWEDLAKREAELVAKLDEVRAQMTKAPHKPAK